MYIEQVTGRGTARNSLEQLERKPIQIEIAIRRESAASDLQCKNRQNVLGKMQRDATSWRED